VKIVTTASNSTIYPGCSTVCSHVISSPNHHFPSPPEAPVHVTVGSAGVGEQHFDGEGQYQILHCNIHRMGSHFCCFNIL